MNTSNILRGFKLVIVTALTLCAGSPLVRADDTDVFFPEANLLSGASQRNVLIVLDNTANWAGNDQGFPAEKQGQAEVAAIKAAIAELDSSTSVGLMEFVTGGSGQDSGGFIRYHMRPMNDTNKAALTAILTDIYPNYNNPDEKRNANAPYGNLMKDVYSYLSGGTPHSPSSSVVASKADAGGYVSSFTKFRSPLSGDGSNCGPTSIIFVSNPNAPGVGPTDDDAANTTTLSGLGGNTTQLTVPAYTSQTITAAQPLGFTSRCYASLAACSTTADYATQCSTAGSCFCADSTTTPMATNNPTSYLPACGAGTQRYTVKGVTNDTTPVSDNTVINNVTTSPAITQCIKTSSTPLPVTTSCPASSTTITPNTPANGQTTTVTTTWSNCAVPTGASAGASCSPPSGGKTYTAKGDKKVRTLVTNDTAPQTFTPLGNTFACYANSGSCSTTDYTTAVAGSNNDCTDFNGGCVCTNPTFPANTDPTLNGTCPVAGSKRYEVDSTVATISVTPTGSLVAADGTYNFDEWARFFQQVGVNGKKINTYTIDVFKDKQSPKHTRLMLSAAKVGSGKYFSATNETEIVSSLDQIFAEVLDIDTTFAAPAVTVNTFNRLTNRDELYFALFKPQAQVKWEGNLKKYKLGQISGVTKIIDTNNADAVDTSTGFFKSTAQSVWSSAVDGPEVSLGGAVSKLTNTRSTYTYTGANKPPASTVSPVDVSASAHSLSSANTANITKAMVGLATTAPDSDLTNILDWAHGIDVDDVDLDNDRADARQSLGDPLHSQPAVINYKGTEASPDITVYFGDNEGALHAVDAATGVEIFAFTPKELLTNLSNYRNNVGDYRHRPYGLDGPITRLFKDLNNDLLVLNSDGTVQSTGGVSEFVYLYAGMRRGGKNYYSMDVTDRLHPKLRWVIYGGTDKYSELGQTWSDAVVRKIKLNGVIKDVLIFTGGYDPAEDSKTTLSGDSQGRAVYIADAVTGERLWWASSVAQDAAASPTAPNLTLSDMVYSIPASPKVVDLDADGIADRIYVADAGGQIFRIILNDSNTGASNLATGSRIAVLSDANVAAASRTAANARRFFASPDVALIDQGGAQRYLTISIGSGFREKPNDTAIQDRFYVLRDPDSQKGSGSVLSITESSLFDTTDNLIGQGTSAQQATAQASLDSSSGFYIRLVDSAGSFVGEKVFTESLTVASNVIFASFTPNVTTNACSVVPGQSKLYLLSVINGTPVVDYSTPNPQLCSATSCDKVDRSIVLAQQGLPSDPAIIFPSIGGGLVCIGSECNPAQFVNTVSKVHWFKRSE